MPPHNPPVSLPFEGWEVQGAIKLPETLEQTPEITSEATEKKLWGTPLKLKQAEERIAALEAEIEALKGSVSDPADPEMACVGHTGDTKAAKGIGDPYHWVAFTADGEKWEYKTRLRCWNDVSWGSYIFDRIKSLAGSSIGGFANTDGGGYRREIRDARIGPLNQRGDESFEKLPAFNQQRCVEVIVRIS